MATASGSPRARALAAALRQARVTRQISLRQLAINLSMDPSNLSKVECGKKVPSPELTARILGALHTPSKECEKILNLARNATEPNWLTVGIPGMTQQLAGVVEHERAASAITEWAPTVIPGLLQTTDYTLAIVGAHGRLIGLTHDEIRQRTNIKAERRKEHTNRTDLQCHFLLSAAALHEPIGTPKTMVGQLRHLITFAQRPNVFLRVVPERTGWHAGLLGSFVLYDFLNSPSVVYFEHFSSGAFVDNKEDIRFYRKAVDTINRFAMSLDETVEHIARVIVKDWE